MADELRREFAISFADLIGICDNIHSCMVRDATEMLGYGITNLITAAFKTKIDEFLALPTDSVLASDAMIATQSKNEKANELKIMLRTFGTRAKLSFGDNKLLYEKFVLKDLSHATDTNLLVFSEMVSLEAVKYLTELAVAGLTQPIIDDLVDLTDEFRSLMIAQDDAVMLRDDASNNRIKKANELYKLLTNYCEVGKTIWYETNEAKYNDYIIYNSISPGSLTAPTNLSFYFPTKTISWDAVDNATSYQLQWSIDGDEANYVEIYSGSDTSYVYNEIATPLNYLRARARNNNGYGDWSDVLIQGYFVTLPPPVILGAEIVPNSSNAVRVVWEEVPSATKYRVYRSTVNIGDPAGSWVLVSQETNTSLIETVGEGKRYYYRLTAENSYQASVVSSSVFVDVPVAP